MYTRFAANGCEKISVRLDNGIVVSGKPAEFEKLGECNGIFQFAHGYQYGLLVEVLIWTDNIVK